MSSESTSAGIGIGGVLALLISVALNKSFLWAIIHLMVLCPLRTCHSSQTNRTWIHFIVRTII